MADIASLIIAAVHTHGAIHDAYLVGSRATGNAGPLSDWDFRVDTHDFSRVQRDLPSIASTLAPLAQQWDRLSDRQCYMLILAGAIKVDLIFDVPNVKASPWHVTASSLSGMELHFWDWILWLASKVMAGRDELVRSELEKLYEHLLAPMNAAPPEDIAEAIRSFTSARDRLATDLNVHINTVLERAVCVRLRAEGLAV